MRYFVPTDKNAGTVNCYGGTTASSMNPAGLDGYRADKAANNPDFTEVVKAEPKTSKKKASKKKAAKK